MRLTFLKLHFNFVKINAIQKYNQGYGFIYFNESPT